MRTIKFEGKKIVITGENIKEVFTLYESTELRRNTQFIVHEGITFYLTEIIEN